MEVQQVTTQTKAKALDWEVQDEIRKTTKEWIVNANTQMGPESTPIRPMLTTEENDEDDPIWQALADCEIKIPMQKLLELVPRFDNW